MRQERFDELARELANPISRGRMLKLLGGTLLGSALGGWSLILGAENAEAKHKKGKHKKKHKKPPSPVCKPANAICNSTLECCSDENLKCINHKCTDVSNSQPCGSISCSPGQICCNNQCADPDTAFQNCGGCGVICPADQSCTSGACLPTVVVVKQPCNGATCSPGQTCCPDELVQPCVDTSTDDFNCGSCGVICPGELRCQNGSCQCPSGKTNCSGICIDTSTDPFNCGTCGKECAGDNICVNGTCQCDPNDNDGPDGDNDCDDGVPPS